MNEEAEKKRQKANHYRELAQTLSDKRMIEALNELAGKLEREAEELERHSNARTGQT